MSSTITTSSKWKLLNELDHDLNPLETAEICPSKKRTLLSRLGNDLDDKIPPMDPKCSTLTRLLPLGDLQSSPSLIVPQPLYAKPTSSSDSTQATQRDIKDRSPIPLTVPSSLILNGRMYWLDEPSTLTSSSETTTPSLTAIGDLKTSETLKSVMDRHRPKNLSPVAIAWGITSTAISYAFPNRSDELNLYGRYILGLFTATNSLFHDRVIAFDKAIRQRVSST